MLGKKKSHNKVTFDQHAGKTSLIADGVAINGDVRLVGGLQVDGKVTGNIDASGNLDALVRVSESGEVAGELRAPNIVINGRVFGDVYSDGHVELGENCVIEGTVYYNLIEVMMGAQVNGSLVHLSEGVETDSAPNVYHANDKAGKKGHNHDGGDVLPAVGSD